MKSMKFSKKVGLIVAFSALSGITTALAEMWELPPPIVTPGGTGSTAGPETKVVVLSSGKIVVLTPGFTPPANDKVVGNDWPSVVCPMQKIDPNGNVALIAVPIADVEREMARGATVPANYNNLVVLKKVDETGNVVFTTVEKGKQGDLEKEGWKHLQSGKNKVVEGIVMRTKDGRIIVVTPHEVNKYKKLGAAVVEVPKQPKRK
jgi:hypothetical protein